MLVMEVLLIPWYYSEMKLLMDLKGLTPILVLFSLVMVVSSVWFVLLLDMVA